MVDLDFQEPVEVIKGDKLEIFEGSINYKDVFSMEFLYKLIREWLITEGWEPDKYLEKFYLEKRTGAGKEQWIWWRTSKSATEFIKMFINVDYHTLGLKDVEVVHEGNKVKSNKGEIEIAIRSYIVLDPDAGFKKNPILKYFRSIFIRRRYRDQKNKYKKELYDDTVRLQGTIKQYLELKGFISEQMLFHPPKGVGF